MLEERNREMVSSLVAQSWQVTGTEYDMPEAGVQRMLQQILQQEKVRNIKNDRPWRWYRAAAASIILALGVGGYFLFFDNKKDVGQAETVQTEPGNDIKAPDISRATITLADGSIVYLDSVSSGTIAMQRHVKIIKTADEKLVYAVADTLSGKGGTAAYNTLSNPRGSKVIDITLSDGSHVWLNAGSSITFPVAFWGNERKVSITGEVYFEAASSPVDPGEGGRKRPFVVEKGDMQVIVLGTKFNINAYDDETDIKVTLLEGSVKVSNSRHSVTIRPGEQASVSTNALLGIGGVDVEEVMAWKNGRFIFGEKADMPTILRQVARWYDVEVEYHGPPHKYFWGSISREVNVSEIIKVLEATGDIRCRVEGRKLIVMP